MPRICEMFPGRFLRQDEVEAPILVTIAQVKEQDVAREGESPDFKWVMHFEELEKPLILTFPRVIELKEVLRSDRSEDWIGMKVEIYSDPLIVSNGRAVGAVRFRLPKRRKKSRATK